MRHTTLSTDYSSRLSSDCEEHGESANGKFCLPTTAGSSDGSQSPPIQLESGSYAHPRLTDFEWLSPSSRESNMSCRRSCQVSVREEGCDATSLSRWICIKREARIMSACEYIVAGDIGSHTKELTVKVIVCRIHWNVSWFIGRLYESHERINSLFNHVTSQFA